MDNGDGTTATAQNTRGMLAFVSDCSGEEHSSYDARGRVQYSVKRIPDPVLASPLTILPSPLVSFRTSFEYDSLDRVTRMIYPDNDEITYEYNERTLLRRIPGGPNTNVISAINYVPSGQQREIDLGNGVQTTYNYDPRLRLGLLNTAGSDASTPLISFGYDFDGVSNLRQITDLRPASSVPASDSRRNTQAFAYDDLYRLTGVKYNAPNPTAGNGGGINYRYDRIGNMLAQTSDIAALDGALPAANLGTMESGGTLGRFNRTGRQSADPPGPHALSQISNPQTTTNRQFAYDANGNMTVTDGFTNTWDFKNRLVACENAGMRAAYTYDATDRRISRSVSYKPGSPNFTNHTSRLTTLYVSRAFEVRDHDAPTKYVFNGSTRIASVTGSLSSNPRIQRLRVQTGWNLCSVAVTASGTLAQLANLNPGLIQAAYQWSSAASNWLAVGANEALPAGTVLWLNASTNAVLSAVGTYADPASVVIPAGDAFLPSTGLEAWPLTNGLPAGLVAWFPASPNSPWQTRFTGEMAPASDFPAFLAPGRALFGTGRRECTPGQPPDPLLRIRYYHQDHLGSSSVITDARGNQVEETAFFPSGVPRSEWLPRQVREPYQFTQKERDAETGLHYFEARYLAANMSRFNTPDSRFANPDVLSSKDLEACLAAPQELNLYSYVQNNPLKYLDPTGLEGKALIIVGAGQEELSRVHSPSRQNFDAAAKAMLLPQTKGLDVEIVHVNSAAEMVNKLKSGSWDTVVYMGHGVTRSPQINPSGKHDPSKFLDEAALAAALKQGNPKNVYLLGCAAVDTGLARTLSKDLPDSGVNGIEDVLEVNWEQKGVGKRIDVNQMSHEKPFVGTRTGLKWTRATRPRTGIARTAILYS